MNRAVLPYMRDAGSGLIVHVTSGVARIVMPFMAHYSASKFAVEALAESYRYELAPLGVDSVVVEPEPIRVTCRRQAATSVWNPTLKS